MVSRWLLGFRHLDGSTPKETAGSQELKTSSGYAVLAGSPAQVLSSSAHGFDPRAAQETMRVTILGYMS